MRKTGQRQKPKVPKDIYKIKITLLDIKPPIWRSVAVPGDITLAKLHNVIQAVMGWTNSHLHEFRSKDMVFAVPDPEYDTVDVINERRVKLSDVIEKPKRQFQYIYDFGDDWIHQILVEQIGPPEPGMRYPICLAGKRACPPEDCGGSWGYENMLKALADPNHEEHETMVDWIGDDFDSEEFDLEETNRILRESLSHRSRIV
jgi:hypothetical protein